jgi:hypothetical protein
MSTFGGASKTCCLQRSRSSLLAIERRLSERDRLSLVTTRVRPRAKQVESYALATQTRPLRSRRPGWTVADLRREDIASLLWTELIDGRHLGDGPVAGHPRQQQSRHPVPNATRPAAVAASPRSTAAAIWPRRTIPSDDGPPLRAVHVNVGGLRGERTLETRKKARQSGPSRLAARRPLGQWLPTGSK